MANPSDGTFARFLKSRNGVVFLGVIAMGIVIALLGTIFLLQARDTVSRDRVKTSFIQTDLGDGWIRYEHRVSPRFALSLPESWDVTGFSPDEIEEILKSGAKDNPELEELIQNEATRQIIKCCLKMMAFDTGRNAESGFRTNINVLSDTLVGEVDFDRYIDEQLSFIDDPALYRAHLRSGDGNAELVEFERDVVLPSGERATVSLTQFYFLKGYDSLIITCTTSSDEAGYYSGIFQRIGHSFEWL